MNIAKKYHEAKQRASDLLHENGQDALGIIAIAAVCAFIIAIITEKSGFVNFVTFWILLTIWVICVISAIVAFLFSWKGLKFKPSDNCLGVMTIAIIGTVVGIFFNRRSDVWITRDRVQVALQRESFDLQHQREALTLLQSIPLSDSTATSILQYSVSSNSWIIPLTIHPFPGASGILPSKSKSNILKIAISIATDSSQILTVFEAVKSFSDSTYDNIPRKSIPSSLMFGVIERHQPNDILWLHLPSRISPAAIYTNPQIINRQFKDERPVPAEQFLLPPISIRDIRMMEAHLDRQQFIIDSCNLLIQEISKSLTDRISLEAFVERVNSKTELREIRKLITRKF